MTTYEFEHNGYYLSVEIADSRTYTMRMDGVMIAQSCWNCSETAEAWATRIAAEIDLDGIASKIAANAAHLDRRYSYATCACCGREYQRIDFRSAPHLLLCVAPVETA
jgi:hypothetical protein